MAASSAALVDVAIDVDGLAPFVASSATVESSTVEPPAIASAETFALELSQREPPAASHAGMVAAQNRLTISQVLSVQHALIAQTADGARRRQVAASSTPQVAAEAKPAGVDVCGVATATARFHGKRIT